MNKNLEINLNEVIANTRQSASYIGSLLGKTFGKVECQMTWPGGKEKFEEAKNLAAASNSLMLNMSPRRYTIRLIDIKGVNYVTEGLGDTQHVAIAVNLKENGESDFKCPLNGMNPIIVEKSMRDAINDALKGTGKNFFVAVDEDAADGAILGYAFCVYEVYAGHNNMTDHRTLYIDDICVDEAARGKHVGTTIYQHVINFARTEGFYNVTLNVWSCNPGAQAFYEAMGMKPYKVGMETIL